MNENLEQTNPLHPPSIREWPLLNNCSRYYDDSKDAEQGTYRFSYFLKVTCSFYQGVCYADLQDIAQEAWISYSRRSEKGDIDKPESYIAMVIRNKFRDFIRKEKRRFPLPTIALSLLSEHPEVEFVLLSSRSLVNPVNEIDDLVETMDILNDLAVVLPKVPPRQRRAMICTLLDKVDDPFKLKQVLKSHHIDASEMCWPSNNAEKHLLQASLPAARRALALLLNIDLHQFKERKRVSD
jgi:DNA-directed RNA polymerase specialized sigma24 family protein